LWGPAPTRSESSPFFDNEGSNFHDYEASVWDVVTRQLIGKPLDHSSPVNSADFSPDGTRMITTSQDSTAGFGTWRAASRSGSRS
jgi:WD40 repeat protein